MIFKNYEKKFIKKKKKKKKNNKKKKKKKMSYSWSQTDVTVRISFFVAPSTKQSDLQVEITRESLSAGLVGIAPCCQVCNFFFFFFQLKKIDSFLFIFIIFKLFFH